MSAWALMLGLGLAVALFAGAAAGAFAAGNALKKLAAIFISLVAAALTLALLGASSAAPIAVMAIAFAYCLVGVALVVRLQEAYGSIEQSDLDAADERDEPAEPLP